MWGLSNLEFTSEEKIILDTVHDGITVNSQGILLYVNKRFSEMIGYPESELIGMNVLDLTAVEYRDLVHEKTRLRQAGMEVESLYQVELIKKDGTRLPVEYSVSQIDFFGKSSSLTIIRDISSRLRFRIGYIPVFEALNEAIAIFDTENFS